MDNKVAVSSCANVVAEVRTENCLPLCELITLNDIHYADLRLGAHCRDLHSSAELCRVTSGRFIICMVVAGMK